MKRKGRKNCPECAGYGGDWEFIANGPDGVPVTRWVPCKRCEARKKKQKRK